MKILTIIGARPQFIKAAAISRCIRNQDDIQEIIIHTGQHYDSTMSDIFFDEMDIPRPDYNLGVQETRHGKMTAKMLSGIEEILIKEDPNWVLVYGDTNSTLAGSLAAVKLHYPVAHVEAGLRSFNRNMPEEINRILTDHSSDLLFTPTDIATKNLAQEGITGSKVKQVGDVMYDVSLFYAQQAKPPAFLEDLGATEADSYVLATIHRVENTDDPVPLKNILHGLSVLEIPVILPIHPRTQKKLGQTKANLGSNVHLVDPVGFLEMVWLEKNAEVIVTDSGGVQKEACFHGVPCVTVREETEWVELVETGWNRLSPPLSSDIRKEVSEAIGSKGEVLNLYGEGDAADKIVNSLVTCNKLDQ